MRICWFYRFSGISSGSTTIKRGSGPHPGRHGTPPVTIDYVMDLSIPCVMYGHPVLRIDNLHRQRYDHHKAYLLL